jgi:nudix-type nucleoside diphosphatase (YffH/AdpP family)
MSKVDIFSKKIVFDDFFKIEAAIISYQRFDGEMSRQVRRLNFIRGDSVAAVLYNENKNTVILVNQFKYPTMAHGSGWIIELVAGTVSKDEDPAIAIRREILEETGYSTNSIEHLNTFYVSPGGSSERIWLYLGKVDATQKVSSGGGLSSEDEDIEILEMPLSKALEGIRQGLITDAKTIIGLMWLMSSKEV